MGAPTPNVDRLAREGLLLTSCYSEPSCTPTRGLDHDRAPAHAPRTPDAPHVRHARRARRRGHAAAAPVRRRLRHPGRGQVAHGREPREPAPARRVRRLLRLPVGVGHVHRMARPVLLPRDRLQRRPHRVGEEHAFSKCFVHAERGGELEEVEEVTIPVLSLLDDKWCTLLGARSSSAWRRGGGPGSSTTAPGELTSTTIPIPTSSGRSPAKHPYKDAIVELDDICGRLVDRPRANRSARVDDGRHLVRQRTGDGDVARLGLHPVSLRQGVHLGGRRPGAGRRVVARHGRRRAGRATGSSTSWTCSPPARRSRGRRIRFPTIGTSTRSTRRRSSSPPVTRTRSSPTASSSTTGSPPSTRPCGWVSTST